MGAPVDVSWSLPLRMCVLDGSPLGGPWALSSENRRGHLFWEKRTPFLTAAGKQK